MARQRHVAFFLPQFHPIPENDEWWGPGFTEWRNVVQAAPRFPGHLQPHLPRELGFYDLRLPEVRRQQAILASSHGIDAFCYYHYWFGDGRRLLERPVDELLASGEPDMPFCLAWANENWTRRWDGRHRAVLMSQDYRDQRAHARWLAQAFRDERYLRHRGRPLFLVYRASQVPDPVQVTRTWRDEARRAGVGEIFLARVESFPDERTDPHRLGFDAAVEFAPDWLCVPRSYRALAASRLRGFTPRGRRRGTYRAVAYDEVVERMMAKPAAPYVRYPCVTPGWDNSARRKKDALVLTDATPARYEQWVAHASRTSPGAPDNDSLVFVNAWNEWGEGAHLEPDLHWGTAFLEAHAAGRRAASARVRS